jgi:hypothetical protein
MNRSEYNLAASELADIRKEDRDFNNWYNEISDKFEYSKNPDDLLHFYDYRKAFKQGVRGPDKSGHWPSRFKHDLHPNRYIPKGGKNEGWWDTKYEKDAKIEDIIIWKEKRNNLLQQTDYWNQNV